MAKVKEEKPAVLEVRLLDAKFKTDAVLATMSREIAACFSLAYLCELSAPLARAELTAAIPAALTVASSFRLATQRRAAFRRCADLIGVELQEGEADMALLGRLRRALVGDEIARCPSSLLAEWLTDHQRDAAALLEERRRTAGILDAYQADYEATRERHEADLIRSQQRSGELRGDARDFTREPWLSFASCWRRRSGADFGCSPDHEGRFPSVRREATARLGIVDAALDRLYRAGDIPDVVTETRRELAEARGKLAELQERRREVARLFFQSDSQEQKLDAARLAVSQAEAEVDRLLSRLRHELGYLLAA